MIYIKIIFDSFKRLISNLPESFLNKSLCSIYSIPYFIYQYHGYNIDKDEAKTKDKDNKMIPLSDLPFLHISAFFNSLECFKYLHEEKHLPLRSLSEDNFFPLHYACFK